MINKEYKRRIKHIKKMYKEEERCLNCGGTLGTLIGGLGSNLSMRIADDCFLYELRDEDGKKEKIGKTNINFCPFCGRQIREEIDWSLCD